MRKFKYRQCVTLIAGAFFMLITTSKAVCEGNNYLYKAVIKTPSANVYESAHLKTALVTQALLNEEIEVIGINGSFVYARVPDGYTGYIQLSNVTTDLSSTQADGDKVIVTSKYAYIYDSYGNEITEAPMTSLFFGRHIGNKYYITLPQNIRGYIYEKDAVFIGRNENIPLGNRAAFVEHAMKFIGTKYLWGGCSTGGIDCSGLTYIAAKMNGKKIPRDSEPQSKTGGNIKLSEAIAGDQLFFAADNKKSKVTHTGIYLGEGNFIHSSNKGVTIDNIYKSKEYSGRFMFAKRQF
jgi:hypothetical protein